MKEAVAVTVGGVLLTVYFTWPMSLDPAAMGRVAIGDGMFSIWNVAWVAHALTTPGANLFDANIFHPHRGTLAYSEPNLGAGLLAVPAYLLTGGNPYAAHNSAVLIGLAGAFIGMYLLVRRLTGSREASAIAAIAFAFCPFYFARTAHVQLMMTAPLPFSMLAFHRFADRPSWGSAAVLGVCLGVQALCCSYYGMLAGLLVGLGILVFAAGLGRWREPRWWGLTLVAATVSVVTVLPMLLPYLELQQETGFGRTLDESRRYAADWRAYLASSAYAHEWMLPLIGRWNEVLFPGFTALVGGVAGIAVAWRAARTPHARTVAVFYLLVFGLALWSSFGPAAGLYSLFYYTIPVFSLLRAPARFGLAVTLALAVFAGFAAAEVFRRMPDVRRRRALAAAVAVFAIAELSTEIPYVPARGVPDPYRVLARSQRGAVAEFPFYHLPGDRFRHTLYMLGSTWHWQPLVNGYSDFIPPDFADGASRLEGFPNSEGFAWLKERRVRYAVFHLGLYDPIRRADLLGRIDEYSDYLQPRHVEGTVHLYEIVAWPSPGAP